MGEGRREVARARERWQYKESMTKRTEDGEQGEERMTERMTNGRVGFERGIGLEIREKGEEKIEIEFNEHVWIGSDLNSVSYK